MSADGIARDGPGRARRSALLCPDPVPDSPAVDDRLICTRCGLAKPRRQFRAAERWEICRDCAVTRLSRRERAELRDSRRAFRRRIARGYRPSPAELDEAHERDAALAGLSEAQYRPIGEEMALAWLWWYPSYVLSAVVVGVVAFVLSLTMRPPGLLQWVVTVACLLGGAIPAHWLAMRIYDPAGERIWTGAERSDEGAGGCLVVIWAVVLGISFPVLAYVLVRVIVPPVWPS